MRGFLQPAVTTRPSDSQTTFMKLSRTRRMKLASAAQTTLIKADQWAKGGAVTSDVAESLEKGLKALMAKAKAKTP